MRISQSVQVDRQAIVASRNRGRPSGLSRIYEIVIACILFRDPTLYVDELCDCFEDVVGQQIPRTTMSRWIKRMGVQ